MSYKREGERVTYAASRRPLKNPPWGLVYGGAGAVLRALMVRESVVMWARRGCWVALGGMRGRLCDRPGPVLAGEAVAEQGAQV
jgi:hypothetical protein